MSPSDELILAIDLGTSLTKILVFDLTGRVVSASGAETAVYYPQTDCIESDGDDLWRAVIEGIRAVLSQGIVGADAIRAVGICGFMHTLVGVDPAGRALRPILLWPDQRCVAEVEALSEHRELVARITGRPLTTLSSLPRLLWLRGRHPDLLSQAGVYLAPKDFVRLCLTGEVGTDPHDADGMGLLDVGSGRWSEALLDLVGIPVERMPPILRCDEVAGVVTERASEATGLRAGTPVVVGTGDWFATLVGSGCHLPERSCLYLGSAGILGSFASRKDLDRLGDTRYFGSVTSTGSAVRWIRQLLYEDSYGGARQSVSDAYARICEEGERSPPGARGLVFLPHLMGERGGVMRPGARGVFYGFTLAHRRPDVVRAVLEGTALWLRATTEPYIARQDPGDFVALGGGVRSRLWRRICAAAYGRRLLVPEVLEGAALGAAMLAAVGTGLREGYRAPGSDWRRIAEVELPSPELVDTYERHYRRLRQLEAALSSLD